MFFSNEYFTLIKVSISYTSKVLQWLQITEMWYIRSIMRISWTEKSKNEEVMEMTAYKRFLLKTIWKKTTSLFGQQS